MFPQGKNLPAAATWPTSSIGSLVLPFGLLVGIALAVLVWLLYSRTRFGFEVHVIGDSPRAAALRRHAHAAQDPRGDGPVRRDRRASAAPARTATSATCSTRAGSQWPATATPGIVVAALGRYNPFAVCLVAFLLGGLQNAGYALQGADFPSGLVGVLQGLILFCALGGEVLDPLPHAASRPTRARRGPAPTRRPA